MKVRFTDRAVNRLRAIHQYVSADSAENASRVITRIIDRAESLAEQPLRGRPVPEYLDGEVREVRERPYRIIYRVMADVVQILTIMHEKQLLPDEQPRSD